MGAALVENALVHAIKVCLDDDSDVGQLFYEDKAPFGTFYARIVAAKSFGLVSARLADDLHVIRDIRNQFAHAVLSLDFKNQDIAAECEKLKRFPDWPELKRKRSKARRYYQNACYTLTVHMLRGANKRLEKTRKELEARAQLNALNTLHPEKLGLGGLLQAYLGFDNVITASLKNGGNKVPNDSGTR